MHARLVLETDLSDRIIGPLQDPEFIRNLERFCGGLEFATKPQANEHFLEGRSPALRLHPTSEALHHFY